MKNDTCPYCGGDQVECVPGVTTKLGSPIWHCLACRLRYRKIDTPQCDKLSAIRGEMIIIRNFLEWLGEDVHPMRWGERARLYIANWHPGHSWPDAHHEQIEQILQRYFEIDPEKLEIERQELLAFQREINDHRDRLNTEGA